MKIKPFPISIDTSASIWPPLYACGLFVMMLLAGSVSAQVRVDEANQQVIGELRRVDSLLQNRKWDEAVDTLQRLVASDGNRLYRLDQRRYLPVRQYAQTLLSRLPREALAEYRKRIDPAAEQDYRAGHYERVIRKAYASSYTDDALLALGEAALASGDADRAYRLWEQILPPSTKGTTDQNTTNPNATAPTIWPGLPDSDLDPASVRARLILASILGNHPERARAELARFVELHPDAHGRFAGRDDANYAEVLTELLREPTVQAITPNVNSAWPTFAGNSARNGAANQAVDATRVVWRYPLQALQLSAPPNGYEHQPHRVDLRLAYHPAFQNDLLFLTGENMILGLDARSGKPLWESDGPIYREDSAATLPEGTLGIPQFTTTLRDGRLYARLGTPLTNRASSVNTQSIEVEAIAPDVLVCLDLEAEGRLVWRIEPDGKDWAFDGTPIVDGKNVYVAMRRGGLRPESHVACFDAGRGTMRWRQFVCSAEIRAGDSSTTPGSRPECTHNLLTLHFDTLYFNTNLGAVASLETESGSIRWLTLYPRDNENRAAKIPAVFSARTLCPCVYDRGTIYVAPNDSPGIFVLDAFSGELLWSTGRQTSDVIHLLGTLGNHLIALGDHLYWIATTGEHRGQIVRRFPDGDPIAAHGRGILAEGRIYWPTRERIFVFEGQQLAKTIDLAPLGLTGGNLTISGKQLLITTDREITALK